MRTYDASLISLDVENKYIKGVSLDKLEKRSNIKNWNKWIVYLIIFLVVALVGVDYILMTFNVIK